MGMEKRGKWEGETFFSPTSIFFPFSMFHDPANNAIFPAISERIQRLNDVAFGGLFGHLSLWMVNMIASSAN